MDVGARVVVPALKALGVDRVDAVVLTHPHPDHFGGLSAVLSHFQVAEVWTNGCALDVSGVKSLQEQMQAQGVNHRVIDKPTRITVANAVIEVIHPTPCRAHLSANDNSLVLRLVYRRFSALLTGDIEHAAERIIVDTAWPLKSTLLKVPHHGSKTSSRHGLLRAVDPELAVAQAIDGGRFGLPHAQIEARYESMGIPLLVTGRHGAIQVQSDGRRWEVSQWR